MRSALLLAPALSACLVLCSCRSGGAGGAGAASPPSASLAPRVPEGGWKSHVLAEHPLAGRIYDASAGAFVGEGEVVARLLASRYALLGEKHDNPDHHAVQARLLSAMAERGRRPSVAFEMIEPQAQQALERFLEASPGSASGLGEALGWEQSGWPSFAMYQPIFQAALDKKLALVPANLPREQARRIARGGVKVLGPQLVAALGLDRELPAEAQTSLESELRDSHCGQLPEPFVRPMADAQRARDAAMARAMIDRDAPDGAVLIAGNGHARADRGVPFYLAAAKPDAPVVSVASLEVVRGLDDPQAYVSLAGAAKLPYTFVFFTPRVDEKDPCGRFHPGDRAEGEPPAGPTAARVAER